MKYVRIPPSISTLNDDAVYVRVFRSREIDLQEKLIECNYVGFFVAFEHHFICSTSSCLLILMKKLKKQKIKQEIDARI